MKRTLVISLLALTVVGLSACSGNTDPANSTADNGSASSVATSEDGLAALNGKIVFGTEGTYAPFSYHDSESGDLVGYDVEVAEAVGEKLGLEVEFAEAQWDGIFAALETERFDAIANEVEITEEREAKYDLSDPYSVSYPVVITKTDSDAITTLDDIEGKTSAHTPGSNWGQKAESYGATVETVTGFSEAVTAVKQDRVDMTLNDALAALDYFTTTGDSEVKIAIEITGDKVFQGFAFRKDSGLLPAVNEALAELAADGTLAEIGEKYFGKDVSK